MLQAEGDATIEEKSTQLGIAMHAAVATITETVKEFVHLKIARYIPVSMVAYLTLPIVLNSIDVKTLSSTNARTGAKRRHLRVLNGTMDLCRERYSGTALAQGFIEKTIEDARSEQHGREANTQNSTSMAVARRPVEDWFEIFITKPAEFLRLSFRIDISLSKGFYPKNEELPQCITLQLRLLANKSIPRSLMPPTTDKCGDLIPHEDILSVLGKGNKNSHLDFFNFDEF